MEAENEQQLAHQSLDESTHFDESQNNIKHNNQTGTFTTLTTTTTSTTTIMEENQISYTSSTKGSRWSKSFIQNDNKIPNERLQQERLQRILELKKEERRRKMKQASEMLKLFLSRFF